MPKAHAVEAAHDSADSDSDVSTINSLTAYANGICSDTKNKPIYCQMTVNNAPIKLQVDCGATVSLIPKSMIGDTPIAPDDITLEIWNKGKTKAPSI